ncbi:MAG: L,D-transpeptidase [Verrucomicrobiota bacterium]|nr:L,D-transpeptidase [Verrucomicrobiota bacterium]
MKKILFGLSGLLLAAALFSGCASTGGGSSKGIIGASNYSVPVKKPTNPKDVVVKVSLKNQAVYVMENGQPLMVTATCVGKPGHPTPTGTYKVTTKKKDRRSGTYGFYVNDATGQIKPAHVKDRPAGSGWRYVGHPLPYWVEFYPGYGFHVGWVWPEPKTHGCLRLHENVTADFYDIVEVGNTVIIAESLPEDQTLGRNLKRPTDYTAPDPKSSFLTSSSFYEVYIPYVDSKKKAM